MSQEESCDLSLPPSKEIATWVKYTILSNYCSGLSIANKREIFSVMRQQISNKSHQDIRKLHHMYLPKFGLTLGECSLFHTISEHIRRSASN